MSNFQPLPNPLFSPESLVITWDAFSGEFTGRLLGVKSDPVSSTDRNEVIAALHLKLKESEAAKKVLLQEILKLPRMPDLTNLFPIAKARGIDKPSELWLFIEQSRQAWLLDRSL